MNNTVAVMHVSTCTQHAGLISICIKLPQTFIYRPVDCPDEIHEVICECHQHEAKDRIAFDKIKQAFSKDNIHHYFEESSVQI